MPQVLVVRERVYIEGYMTWLIMVVGDERRSLQRLSQAWLHSGCESALKVPVKLRNGHYDDEADDSAFQW